MITRLQDYKGSDYVDIVILILYIEESRFLMPEPHAKVCILPAIWLRFVDFVQQGTFVIKLLDLARVRPNCLEVGSIGSVRAEVFLG